MNKSELIDEISKKSKLTKKDCNLCLSAITQIIQSSLKKGDNVNLVGFGKFEVKRRAERRNYNPQTKKLTMVPATIVPTFKAGKTLKTSIR